MTIFQAPQHNATFSHNVAVLNKTMETWYQGKKKEDSFAASFYIPSGLHLSYGVGEQRAGSISNHLVSSTRAEVTTLATKVYGSR